MPYRQLQLADAFETVADAVPDRVALVAGDVTRTYAELDDRATRLANHLSAHGIGAGDHVAIHAANCVEWVEAFYGCFKIRAVPININYRYVESELRHLYASSDCVAVIVQRAYVDAVAGIADAFRELRHQLVIGDDYEAALADASAERSFVPRSGDDRYILYTGGTTGLPKGVIWRHEDIILGALNSYRGGPLDDPEQLAAEAVSRDPLVLMAIGPMMHGGSQWAMGNIHMIGGTFVLYTELHFDPDRVLAIAAATGVQSLSITGDAMGKPLAERLLDPAGHDHDLSSVIAITNGAAPLTPRVRDLLRAAVPTAMVVDSYGSTETGSLGIGAEGDDAAAPRFTTDRDTMVFTDDFTPATVGEIGRVARRGPIPVGYDNDERATAATFPVVDGQRWALSGDFARLEDDGSISLLGRGSGVINSGGEKIFAEEVAAALMQHDAVEDAAVIGTPHERWGQQVTALVSTQARWLNLENLRAHCRTLLADYKAPKAALFVDQVPRTPIGKLDYRAAQVLACDLLGIDATQATFTSGP